MHLPFDDVSVYAVNQSFLRKSKEIFKYSGERTFVIPLDQGTDFQGLHVDDFADPCAKVYRNKVSHEK